ncbi:MAG: OmpH family outer membrane protein [Pseudomonadota bacterium]
MRNTTLILLVAAALATGEAAAEKIGIVDPMTAISSTEQYTKAMADLEKDTAGDKAKITKLQAELTTCSQKMKTEGATMSATDAAKLKTDCEAKYRDYQVLGQTFQKTVGERQQAILQDFGPKFQRAVDAVAKEGAYDLIITKEALLFSKPAQEITDKVTIKLNTMK